VVSHDDHCPTPARVGIFHSFCEYAPPESIIFELRSRNDIDSALAGTGGEM